MDADQMQALRDVVEYMREAEWTHFCETTDVEQHNNHIYHSVMLLETYLDGDQNEADPEEGGCILNHDHTTERELCETHD